MNIINKDIGTSSMPRKANFFDRFWNDSWTYIKTVLDVVQEPILILDKNLCVVAANDSFYQTFHVKAEDTEGKSIYKLGNGQWNIESLQTLLSGILPEHTYFKGFQVAHDFPEVGRKVMILNARQIHTKESSDAQEFLPTIALAMEDVTDMMVVAETLAIHSKQIEAKLTMHSRQLEARIIELERELKKSRKGE
jgi:PAS domain-containing protein